MNKKSIWLTKDIIEMFFKLVREGKASKEDVIDALSRTYEISKEEVLHISQISVEERIEALIEHFQDDPDYNTHYANICRAYTDGKNPIITVEEINRINSKVFHRKQPNYMEEHREKLKEEHSKQLEVAQKHIIATDAKNRIRLLFESGVEYETAVAVYGDVLDVEVIARTYVEIKNKMKNGGV